MSGEDGGIEVFLDWIQFFFCMAGVGFWRRDLLFSVECFDVLLLFCLLIPRVVCIRLCYGYIFGMMNDICFWLGYFP